MSDFQAYLARQCAVGRHAFGPGERRRGVIQHIQKELVEVQEAPTQSEVCKEWTDVAILSLDGLLRAARELLRQMPNKATRQLSGEPTNDQVAELAWELLTQKQAKNELRTWPDWRGKSEDVALEHERGIHD